MSEAPKQELIIDKPSIELHQFDQFYNATTDIWQSYYTNLMLVPTFYEKYAANVRTWYRNRYGIIYHPATIESFDNHTFRSWFVASNNIENYMKTEHFKSKIDDEQRKIILSWSNILKSPTAYLIICKAFEANKLFEHFLLQLVQTHFSMQLFAIHLYPISFLFTPNYYGIDGENYNLLSVNGTNARNNISRQYKVRFNCKGSFTTETNVLVHYLGKNGINYTLKLFGYEIIFMKPKPKKSRSKKLAIDEPSH